MRFFYWFLLFANIVYGQIPLDKNLFHTNTYNDSLTINDVVLLEKKGAFKHTFKNETYKYLIGKEANWVLLKIPKQNKERFLSIQNSLFEEIDFYLVNDSIKKLNHHQESYRFPLVKISTNETPCQLFIRTKDAKSFRTEFLIKVFTVEELQKTSQVDYFNIGAYVIGLLVLLISASIIFLYKRQYVILWYMLHLPTLVIEYLISTGTFSQWFVDNKIILTYGLDHVFMLISTLALSEFFRNFYPFNKKTLFCKHIYFIVSIWCTIGIVFAFVDGFSGNIYNVEYYAQTVLNYASLISLIIHCILVYYRVIPIYLFIAFLLPVLGIFANLGDFKEQFSNPKIVYFLYQSVYLGILIEVLVIIFYIIKQSVDGELLSINLKKENSTLKNNFHEELSLVQEQHQNNLMSDVHDSFSGYIQALKLNLLSKTLDNDKINEILDAFKKDYKFLLNSLYVPNVDSGNFEMAISEYCQKMDQLSSIKISFNSHKEKNHLPLNQNIAKLIFKAASELTTNSIKFSEGSIIDVNLALNHDYIELNVKDNGLGFDPNKIPKTSFGIQGLKERVGLLNGRFAIKSFKGTCVSINIPLNQKITE
ncbi:7TM-DISM domain-containing protein [Wenyingzhuangia sp. 1_MG-2023]|nr:7TM-DISM domain-containing protein [Wenyingzhuangia sp. 1_MG-2023]